MSKNTLFKNVISKHSTEVPEKLLKKQVFFPNSINNLQTPEFGKQAHTKGGKK